MKQDEMLIDIHEKVTQIRLDQVKHNERIGELRKDVDKNSSALEKVKASHNKAVGAGIFITFLATLSKFWENIAG